MALKYRLLRQVVTLGKQAGNTLQFARSLVTRKISFARFCEEVADGSTIDEADLRAALTRMVKVLRRHMEEGDSVEIEGLGTFTPTFGSDGVPLDEKFNAVVHIRKPRVAFRAKPSFADLSGVSFERISEEEAAARDAITAKKKAASKKPTVDVSPSPSTPRADEGSGDTGRF